MSQDIPRLYAAYEISSDVVAFMLVLFVFVVERIGSSSRRPASREGRITKHLMTATILINASMYMFLCIPRFICVGVHCQAIHTIHGNMMLVCRTINFLFMVHRAKLAQGISQILNKTWFEKRLPIFFIVSAVLCSMCMSPYWIAGEVEWACVHHTDARSVRFCHGNYSDNNYASTLYALFMIGAYSYIAVVFIGTVALIYLFAVPLHRIVYTDLGTMNANQVLNRKKMKDLLIWSVILSSVNLLTTFATYFSWYALWMKQMAKWDYALNVWTAW